jgi:hypothetical protein
MAVNLLSDFRFQKLGDTGIWLAQHLADDGFVKAIRDPDEFFARADCTIIKDQLKIKVGRVRVDIDHTSTGVFIKRYNAYSWRYRVKSLFCSSGAVRSLSGAILLSRAGVLVGRPLAAVESRRWGILRKSFLLTQEVGGKTVDAYWRENLALLREDRTRRRRFLTNLADLFRGLHEKSIYHNDLKDANILVKSSARSGESFCLLDLEGVRRCRYLSRRRRVKNLVQLNHTFGKHLRWSEKLHFLKSYLGTSSPKRREIRRWVKNIIAETQRRDRRGSAAEPIEHTAIRPSRAG